MSKLLGLIGASFLFATSTFADDYADRLAVANDYAAAAAADVEMDALIDQMWSPMVQQFEASGQTVTEEQIARLRAVYRDNLAEPMMELMKAQGPILADIYTLDELRALRDFYQTPEGREVIRKMPQIMEKQQPMIMSLVMNNMGPIMQAMQEIFQ